MTRRRKYSAEFKREAIRLMRESDRPITDIAEELGVDRSRLYKWKAQLEVAGEDAFPGSGRQNGKDAEIARLKRELEAAREECDILKKAAAYFAKDLQ